ncbi:MAG: Gfo/Idh/MocA family oxidoreductase [Anaerolineaceae bacterium]|nr:Gfo/Idh/MocA family oxidoreductase [Anaerolineaceae bacterium]
MSDETGFTTMTGPAAEDDAPELGVGMLGYAFMGQAHTNALKKLPYMIYPPVARPRLAAICGRDAAAATAAARRYGYDRAYTDWREMLADPAVQVFDNGGPNHAHAEPCIAAAEAGKHVICEKPLGRTAEEARQMLDAVNKAGVQHMVGFNYRFVPAIVQARKLIESGALGRIYHFRASYLQEWAMNPRSPRNWRMDKARAGSGALGDLGTHVLDLARFLVGEPRQVMAMTRTFIEERLLPDGSGRGKVDVDDAFVSLLDFENGALGTVESSRFCRGRKNHNRIEVNGENGTIHFNLERLNEINIYWAGDEPETTRGFQNVLVTEPHHPYLENWWPPGHIIGWEHTFVHEFHHFFSAIRGLHGVAPYGATFEDGYRNAVICDAVLESSATRQAVDVRYM